MAATDGVSLMNRLGTYGRWTFAEFCDVYEMQADFEAKVEEHFNKMIESTAIHRKEAKVRDQTSFARSPVRSKATLKRPGPASSSGSRGISNTCWVIRNGATSLRL